MIKPSEFIHPEDAAALRQLENIPGFPALAKKVMELGYECKNRTILGQQNRTYVPLEDPQFAGNLTIRYTLLMQQ